MILVSVVQGPSGIRAHRPMERGHAGNVACIAITVNGGHELSTTEPKLRISTWIKDRFVTKQEGQ